MTDLMKADEKDELSAAEKAAEREAKRLADEEAKKPAHSPITGDKVYIDAHAVGDNTTIKHSYVGVGPLLVPCTRGEQKAVSGDYLVQVYTLDPEDNTKESLFTFLISPEIYQVLFDALPPPATFAEFQKFNDDRAKLLEERRLKASQLPAPPVVNKPAPPVVRK